MTSKRLGFAIFILAAAWSVAGLNWFAPAVAHAPRSPLLIGTAQAGEGDCTFGSVFTVNSTGDPDQYANSATPAGDPDQYANGADSTATNSGSGSGGSSSRGGSTIKVVIQIASSILGGACGFVR